MTVHLRNGTTVEDPRLDRLVTPHTEHLDKYPLTTATLPAQRTAMVGGFNWYSNLDRPVQRKVRGVTRWVIGDGDLGNVRGGHATCFRPWDVKDAPGWWLYYDQGVEGRCVEFAWLRAMSLHNRDRYDITSHWHYFEMQRRDYWQGGSYPGASPQYEGTSVDAGGQVMHLFGAIPARHKGRAVPLDEAGVLASPESGIAAYRWARDWQTVRTALAVPDHLPGVPLLNSWGKSYPREVILLDSAGERLLREDGEFGMIVDR